MIETARLWLRPFTLDDADSLFELNNDPEVIRYTGDPPFTSRDEALHFIDRYDQYRLYGHGRYAVIEKNSSKFLGWCGLKWNENIREADLGYRFFRHVWGRGFATESAGACLREAYDVFQYPSVIGRVMAPNTRSIRVLQRMGFRFERYIICDGSISEQWRHFPNASGM